MGVKINHINNVLKPENICLGETVQSWAIKMNDSKNNPVLGSLGGRLVGVIVKPIVRIGDVAIHLILAVGKGLAGITITPLVWTVRWFKNPNWKNVEYNWSVKQAFVHMGHGAFCAIDIFISPVLNLFFSDKFLSNMKKEIELLAFAQGEVRSLDDQMGDLGDKIVTLKGQNDELREIKQALIDNVLVLIKKHVSPETEFYHLESKDLEDLTPKQLNLLFLKILGTADVEELEDLSEAAKLVQSGFIEEYSPEQSSSSTSNPDQDNLVEKEPTFEELKEIPCLWDWSGVQEHRDFNNKNWLKGKLNQTRETGTFLLAAKLKWDSMTDKYGSNSQMNISLVEQIKKKIRFAKLELITQADELPDNIEFEDALDDSDAQVSDNHDMSWGLASININDVTPSGVLFKIGRVIEGIRTKVENSATILRRQITKKTAEAHDRQRLREEEATAEAAKRAAEENDKLQKEKRKERTLNGARDLVIEVMGIFANHVELADYPTFKDLVTRCNIPTPKLKEINAAIIEYSQTEDHQEFQKELLEPLGIEQ